MNSMPITRRAAAGAAALLIVVVAASVVLVVDEAHKRLHSDATPLVSALIVTHNRPQFLVNSLRLLELQGMLRAKHATTITPNTPPSLTPTLTPKPQQTTPTSR